MRHIAASLALCALIASPALSLPRDEEALVTGIEALYRTDAPPAPAVSAPRAPEDTPQVLEAAPGDPAPAVTVHTGCGTQLLRQAFDRWDSLSDEAKQRLQPLMEPPGGAPNGVPAAPDASWTTVETAHFSVNYRQSGPDAPPSADYIKNACAYLERAYQHECVELGFTAPPEKETVYFKKLTHNGLTHPLTGKHTWIELNSDILGYTKQALGQYYNPTVVSRDPAGPESGLLKAVCAHEFFHAVQMQYNWGEPSWWSEGGADWMGNEVFPESGFYLNNVGPHLEQPNVTLFQEGDFFDYSASLFSTFLSENLGAATIRKVWEGTRSGTLDQSLSQTLGNFPELFMNYACYNAVRNYKDGAKMPLPAMQTAHDYPAKLQPVAGHEPQYYGDTIFRLVPRQPGTLHIDFSPADRGDVRARIITIDQGNTTWTISRVHGDASGHLVTDVPGFGDRYSQVLIVVGAFSPNAKGHFNLAVDVH